MNSSKDIMQNCYQWLRVLSVTLGVAGLAGCATNTTAPQMSRRPFGQTKDGVAVDIYTLRNSKGAEARISNYGGLVISLKVPDRNGKLGDVVLGYATLPEYIKNSPYFGAMIGRYGNRIAKGKFTLD